MDHSFTIHETFIEVNVKGKITFEDHGEFKTMIQELEKQPGKVISFDLSNLDYIDSAAIGMFLVMKDRVRSEIQLKHAKGIVKKVLTLSNFGQMFVMID